MSLTLRQIEATTQRVDLRELLPHRLHTMDDARIGRLPLSSGNRRVLLKDLFQIERENETNENVILIPLDNKLDFVGAGMREGRILVRGNLGDYAGRGMQGGSLTVEGDTGDCAGSGLRGGSLIICGNTGDRVGSPAAGERQGQHGGFIHVHGNAGSRAGERQRRGVLMIQGNAGDLLGHRMIAGTLYVGGKAGAMAGYGMRRGSLLLRRAPQQLCDTMRYNGRHALTIVRLLLDELRRLSDGAIEDISGDLEVERHLGDLACGGRGEILVLPRTR